ncbi:UNVERIFIED_CONTAM: hypothetical protein GTU68_029111 [Idotea baltica]|nr:hypothetical protein [Idotea baltica]
MGISKDLALLNHGRYTDWHPDFSPANAKQAILAFKGDVYLGLEAETFSEEDFAFAQDHLRILSGLYGLLRPLDLMQPYRLEMGTRLPVRRKKNLYQFWGDTLTNNLNALFEAHESKVLLNLASKEYFSALQPDKIKGEVISPVFKDWKNGQYKIISFFAKKARGRMTSWVMRHRVDAVETIKEFDLDGYAYHPELSEGGEWVFARKQE